MTTVNLPQVLQQAREALVGARNQLYGGNFDNESPAQALNRVYAAIDAIDAALSTPAAPPAGAGGAWQELTDEDRTRAFNSLPDMLDGFMKKWGWLHFARAIEDECRKKNTIVAWEPKFDVMSPDQVHQPVATVDEREPLTEEEIREVVTAEGLQFTAPDIRVARAVERAHGIAAHHPHREDEGEAPAAGVGVVQTPGMPAKLPAVTAALSMCMAANSEARLPVPMCWDLALYVQRLETAVALGVEGTPK